MFQVVVIPEVYCNIDSFLLVLPIERTIGIGKNKLEVLVFISFVTEGTVGARGAGVRHCGIVGAGRYFYLNARYGVMGKRIGYDAFKLKLTAYYSVHGHRPVIFVTGN